MRRARIRVRGTVQGVGFRPFVYGLATDLGLAGHVGNDVAGVFIEVQGERVDDFVIRLREQAPPMASVDAVELQDIELQPGEGFQIVASEARDDRVTSIPADTATCEDCLAELRDPNDRRFGYPFIACTNCGPRYTMVTGLPYDRANTSMAAFPLCDACAEEYADPGSRRYHAQPTACPACGPRLSLPVADVVSALRNHRIVALKGVGGYHLACDPAMAPQLRQRKHRGDKPFAVMVADVAMAQRIAELDARALAALTAPSRPIVLAPCRDPGLQALVAPGTNVIGVMLPYTPLHYLLFDAGCPDVLVMTSGNLSDEPICTDPNEAEERLAGLADLFCHHDRVIQTACDDSVVTADGQPARRSRGYVPRPLQLPLSVPPLVAVGGEIKAAAAAATGDQVWLTQHIGDVENLQTVAMLERSLAVLTDVQRIVPEAIVSDAHPGYLSRRWAAERARATGIPHLTVQHHHAHLASLLAEHRIAPGEPVLGIVFDGTGYGTDGTIWGGELLLGSYAEAQRVGHLRAVQLPGGDAAIAFPWRVALAHLHAADLAAEGSAPARSRPESEQRLLRQMLASGSHCTPTTSMGRLFDAVASLLDVRQTVDYEAQAAIELEASATPAAAWPAQVGWDGEQVVIDPTGWLRLARDAADPRAAAFAFHAGLARAVVEAAELVRQRWDVTTVGLTGGVFSNVLLTEMCVRGLHDSGFTVLLHRLVPPNDGGLSLGQVGVAATRLSAGRSG